MNNSAPTPQDKLEHIVDLLHDITQLLHMIYGRLDPPPPEFTHEHHEPTMDDDRIPF